MSRRTKDAPIKLAIRQDDDAGLIHAYLCMDGEPERLEIATLSLRLAQDLPGVFEAWKDAMTRIIVLIIESTGLEVSHTEDRKPEEPLP